VTPDVTIKISFDTEGTASAIAATTTSSAAPTPMALDALGVAASSGAPSPLTPSELAISQGVASSDEPPAPMAIEQLVSAGSTSAPAPEPLGSLQTVGGAPTPLSLADLGIAAGTQDPASHEPDDEPPTSPGRRGASKRSTPREQ
jgi:hypothetical protein